MLKLASMLKAVEQF